MRMSAIYGFNYGHTRIESLLSTYLARKGSSLKFEQFAGESGEFSAFLKRVLPKLEPSEKRRSEMLNYYYVLDPKGSRGTEGSIKRRSDTLQLEMDKFTPENEGKVRWCNEL
jgi:hypothetical protein